jgi:hypothetical protein
MQSALGWRLVQRCAVPCWHMYGQFALPGTEEFLRGAVCRGMFSNRICFAHSTPTNIHNFVRRVYTCVHVRLHVK